MSDNQGSNDNDDEEDIVETENRKENEKYFIVSYLRHVNLGSVDRFAFCRRINGSLLCVLLSTTAL